MASRTGKYKRKILGYVGRNLIIDTEITRKLCVYYVLNRQACLVRGSEIRIWHRHPISWRSGQCLDQW